MRQAATTADIMGRTFHNLSWVRVGSDEEDDAPADDGDALSAVDEGDGDGFVVKWRNLQMAMKRSLVIPSAMGR